MFSSMNIFGSLTTSNTVPAAIAAGKKKRRRNKKKKAASGKHLSDEGPDLDDEDEEEDENDADNEDLNDNLYEQSPLVKTGTESYQADPITNTIEDVLRRSNFEKSKVHDVVMKMWDNGLNYDDVDAVLEQLHIQEDCDFTVDDEDNVELTKEMIEMATPPIETISRNPVESVQSEMQARVAGESATSVVAHQSSESPSQHMASEVEEITLPARLEAAAAHSDLAVALAALCAWASVTDAGGMKDFFNARALEIILQRVLSDSTEPIPSETRSGLSTLLHHVLRLAPLSSGSTAVSALVESIDSLKAQVLSLKTLTSPSPSHNFLVDSLAHRVGMSIRRLHALMLSLCNGGSIQATLANLDTALAHATAAIDQHIDESRNDSTRSSTLDLKSTFTKRELLHERLLLELEAAEALREATLRPRSATSSARVGGTLDDDESLETAVLAEVGETRASIAAKKSHAQLTRSYVDRVMQDHNDARSSISVELKACIDHVGVLQGRHDDLMLQVQRIEREISLASAKRATLQGKLSDEQKRYDERLSSLDGSQSQVMVALRIEDGARCLVSRVRDLEASLTSVVNGALRPVAPPAEEYPLRVAAVSDALGAYVESEAKCISALANRVKVVENRLQLLRREADEYRALDMQTIGAEIEGTIDKLSENAAEDTRTLSALRTALSEAIQRFASCLTADLAGVGMVAMPTIALAKAVSYLLDAGVAIPHELTPFIGQSVSMTNGASLDLPPGMSPAGSPPQDMSGSLPSSSTLLSSNRTSFQSHSTQMGQERFLRTESGKTPVANPQRPTSQAHKAQPLGKTKKAAPPQQTAKVSNQPAGKSTKPVPLGARSMLKPAAPSTSPVAPPPKSSWTGWKVPVVVAANIVSSPDSMDAETADGHRSHGAQEQSVEEVPSSPDVDNASTD